MQSFSNQWQSCNLGSILIIKLQFWANPLLQHQSNPVLQILEPIIQFHSTSVVLEHNPAKLHQNLGFKEPASRTVCRANAMGLQRHRPPVQCSSWIQHNPLSFIILQPQQSLVIMQSQPRALFQELSIVHRHPAIALSYNLLNPNAIIKSIHSPTIPSEELVEG